MKKQLLIIFLCLFYNLSNSQQQEVPEDEERGCLNSDFIEVSIRSADGGFDLPIDPSNFNFCKGIYYQFEYTFPNLENLNDALVFTVEKFQGNSLPFSIVYTEAFTPAHTFGTIEFQYSFPSAGYYNIRLKLHAYNNTTGVVDPVGFGNDVTQVAVFEDATYTVSVDNTPNNEMNCFSVSLLTDYPEIYHGPCDGDPAHAGWYRNLYVDWDNGVGPISEYNSSKGAHQNPLFPLTNTYDQSGYYDLHFYEQTTCQGEPFYNDHYFTIWAGPPQVFLSATQPFICAAQNTGANITATVNSNGNDNYAWSSSDGSVNAIGINNISVTPTNTTTYTVTVTDFNGCETVESYTLYVENCCTGSLTEETFTSDPHSPIDLSTIPTFFFTNNNNTVALNGVFRVSGNFVIENCPNITLASNSEIIIESGGSLTINNSHLQSCGKLWKGITARSGSTIEILNNSIIEDAIQAVTTEANANYRFENSTFDNNLNGLHITGTANGTISGCQFTNSTGTLLPPHAGEPSNKGIEAWATDNIEIGPGNVFDGLQTGISLWLTNANVNECTFQNLVTDPLNPLNTGIGIYAQGDFGIPGYTPAFTKYNLNVYGMGKNAPSPNFSNLRTGIMLRNMNAKEIINNYMNGVAYGVRAQLCHGGYININENRFANVSNTGVLFTNNLGAQMLIANNNLSGQKMSINPTGVHIDGFGDKVSNLIVGLNRFDRFTYGVRMNKVSGDGMDIGGMGAHIWNNDFYSTLSQKANNIHLTACERISISENYIEGAPASSSVNPNSASGITNAKHNGVYLQSTANYWLRCNNFDNLSSAVYSFGSNPTGKDNITTNLMHRHFYGWNLRKFGLDGEVGPIGAGISNRNDFNDGQSSYYSGVQIWGHNNLTSGLNDIYTLLQDGLFTVSGTNGILPFNLYPAQAPLGECASVPEGDLQMLIDDETYYEELKALEAVNGDLAQTTDPLYQEVVDFEAKREVYSSIDQDTTLKDGNTTLESFYDAEKEQNIGKLWEAEKSLIELSDSTVLKDTTDVKLLREALKQKYESIVDVKNYEYNEKRMWRIYETNILSANDQLSSTDKNFVIALSNQCPLIAGDAVYLARGIHSLFAEDNEFDDETICDGYYKKEKANDENPVASETQLRVFPNPAKGQTLVAYFVPATSAGKHSVSLKTIEGKEVFTQQILAGGSAVTINLSDIAGGLYFVELTSNGAVLKTNKLTVQH